MFHQLVISTTSWYSSNCDSASEPCVSDSQMKCSHTRHDLVRMIGKALLIDILITSFLFIYVYIHTYTRFFANHAYANILLLLVMCSLTSTNTWKLTQTRPSRSSISKCIIRKKSLRVYASFKECSHWLELWLLLLGGQSCLQSCCCLLLPLVVGYMYIVIECH